MTSTAKRAQTMAARYLTTEQINEIARKQNRTTTTPRKSAPVRPQSVQPKPKPDWRTRPASDAQIARVHRCERDLGYKLSDRATIGNAGQASDLYQSLKAEIHAL
jgi:hypothetical protein